MAERRQQKNCDPFFVPMARFDGSIDGTAYPMTMMDHLTMVDQRRALSVRTSTSGQGEVTRGCAQGAQAWPIRNGRWVSIAQPSHAKGGPAKMLAFF